MMSADAKATKPDAEAEVKGDPAVSVRAPVAALIWKTQMSPLLSLPTNKNRPCGSVHAPSVVAAPDAVAVNGLPGIAVSAPVERAMLNPSTVEFPVGTYTYFLVTSMMSAKLVETDGAVYPVKGANVDSPLPAPFILLPLMKYTRAVALAAEIVAPPPPPLPLPTPPPPGVQVDAPKVALHA